MIECATRIEHLTATLAREGAAVLADDLAFLSADEWGTLEHLGLRSGLPYESVRIGDAGERNEVDVGRLMTDVDEPRVVNESVSRRMLDVLAAPRRLAFLERLVDRSPLFLRRAQINLMQAGSFIGQHVDQDSNPDYDISVVLQFGHSFQGGEFVVHRPDGGQTTIAPRFRSVTISRCDYAHEVRRVLSGVRTSLVYFVSAKAGGNRRLSASQRPA